MERAWRLRNGNVYAKLPAQDFDRARQFYVDTLGLRPTWEGDGYVRFDCASGSSFLVFASSGKSSGDHDQCGWIVDDIEAEVADLRRRGVMFEEFGGATFVGGSETTLRGGRHGSETRKATCSTSGATVLRAPDES